MSTVDHVRGEVAMRKVLGLGCGIVLLGQSLLTAPAANIQLVPGTAVITGEEVLFNASGSTVSGIIRFMHNARIFGQRTRIADVYGVE